MNKFQKVASKLAKKESKEEMKKENFRLYKNEWMKKFKNQGWNYPNILKYKNDYISWATELKSKIGI